MEKPKHKGIPRPRWYNLVFLAVGIIIGVAGTMLVSTAIIWRPALPTPVPLMPSPTYPVVPTLVSTYPVQMPMPQATIIAPRVQVAALSPDGRFMAVAAWDNGQGRLDLHEFAVQGNLTGTIYQLAAPTGMIDKIQFSPSGDKLAAMSLDYMVWIYDVRTKTELTCFQGQSRAAFSPDGKWLVLGGGHDGLRVLEAASLNFAESVPVDGYIHALTISPDSQHLAVAVADNSGSSFVRVMNLNNLHGPYSESNAGGYVYQMAFHPSGSVLAVASDNSVRVLYLVNGSQRFFSLAEMGRVRTIAFSPDGTWLAAGGGDTGAGLPGMIYAWRWDESAILRPDADWREMRVLAGHIHDVNSITFTPDGAYLLSASSDGSIRLWDYMNGGVEVSRMQI